MNLNNIKSLISYFSEGVSAQSLLIPDFILRNDYDNSVTRPNTTIDVAITLTVIRQTG